MFIVRVFVVISCLGFFQAKFIKDITDCPCSDASLCQPIQNTTRKEIFAFSLRGEKKIWSKYDYSKLTTVVMVGYVSQDLMCYAHARGVRVVTIANIAKTLLPNATARSEWLEKQMAIVENNFLDGINIDFEDPIYENETNYRDSYSLLVSETYSVFKRANPVYQVTVDVAWSSDGIDLRYYNYTGLAQYTDFLFVMAYDEQSQIRGPCVAGANSPLYNAISGIKSYLLLGIPSYKLVLGIPWYGYMYTCLSLTEDDLCYIKHVPFRGVNCSDAAGTQINYSDMNHYLTYSIGGGKWNFDTETPYFNFVLQNVPHQMQYDNPASLSIKFQVLEQLDVRGFGMWNADAVDYLSNSSEAIKGRTEMWGAFPKF